MKNTHVLTVDPQQPEAALIRRAAKVLRAGGLVAFPTETVYGLGADALNAEAVRGIFLAKERPAYDPIIVHVTDVQGLERLVRSVPPPARTLVERFWPGPLTLVLPRASVVPDVVTAGGETVAVRAPSHPVAQALIRAAGVPIAAPSANRFGQLSPTRAEDVLADLEGRVDVVLDAGATPVGVESTVLSLVNETPTILRPGGLSREVLESVLGRVRLAERPVQPAEEPVTSPGTLPQHYAPRARLILYRGAPQAMLTTMREEALRRHTRGERVGLLLAAEDLPFFAGLPLILRAVAPADDLPAVARRLFATLRALDAAEVEVILARDFGTAGLGLAVRDRLTRAAGGHVIEVGKRET
ncbi:MAG: L-threonylcarbamoyladenylate synthase [Anaerolineae bacterium]